MSADTNLKYKETIYMIKNMIEEANRTNTIETLDLVNVGKCYLCNKPIEGKPKRFYYKSDGEKETFLIGSYCI